MPIMLASCRSLLSMPQCLSGSQNLCLLLQTRRGLGRSYHSEHHPELPPFLPVQTAILSASLNRVPECGFSSQALSLGAKDAGYLEVSVQLFPRGVYDLINFHLVTQRLALKDRVQFPVDTKLGIGKKVRVLTLERLKANKDIIHQWQAVSRSLCPSDVYCFEPDHFIDRHSATCPYLATSQHLSKSCTPSQTKSGI